MRSGSSPACRSPRLGAFRRSGFATCRSPYGRTPTGSANAPAQLQHLPCWPAIVPVLDCCALSAMQPKLDELHQRRPADSPLIIVPTQPWSDADASTMASKTMVPLYRRILFSSCGLVGQLGPLNGLSDRCRWTPFGSDLDTSRARAQDSSRLGTVSRWVAKQLPGRPGRVVFEEEAYGAQHCWR